MLQNYFVGDGLNCFVRGDQTFMVVVAKRFDSDLAGGNQLRAQRLGTG